MTPFPSGSPALLTKSMAVLLMRDADGSLIDDDKAVWIQGRATWLLATLYNTIEKNRNGWMVQNWVTNF
jgi:hypothetical protein